VFGFLHELFSHHDPVAKDLLASMPCVVFGFMVFKRQRNWQNEVSGGITTHRKRCTFQAHGAPGAMAT
jgi:hypothetical protein